MKLKNALGLAAFSAVLLAVISGCSASHSDAAATESSPVGTAWTGTDSDGDTWGLDFESDGTVGLTYDGKAYDDESDRWKLAGDDLSIHVGFGDGDVELAGTYGEGDTEVDLDGTYAEGSFTLTITR